MDPKIHASGQDTGAHLLHTSEASLSGYAGVDFATFDDFDWDLLRHETTALCRLARELELWLVLGSAHYLDAKTKPTNCLYLINPSGRVVDRYDKSMCTFGDQQHYTAGNRLVTREIRGVKVGWLFVTMHAGLRSMPPIRKRAPPSCCTHSTTPVERRRIVWMCWWNARCPPGAPTTACGR